MSFNTKKKGRNGEEIAATFLEEKGYRIVERNYKTSRAEVDIIAVKGNELVFCEVKHWSVLDESSMEQSITREKKRRIISASKVFLSKQAELSNKIPRFDVLFLNGKNRSIRHFIDAFSEDLK